MKHLNDEAIIKYLENEVSDKERKKIEEHLNKCVTCARAKNNFQTIMSESVIDKEIINKLIHLKTLTEEKTKDCPEDEVLCAYIDGELSQKENQEFENHMLDCKYCFYQVAALRISEFAMQEDAKRYHSHGTEKTMGHIRLCDSCNRCNTHSETFCNYCGQQLPNIEELRCIYCEARIRPESKYCPNCGKNLLIEKIEEMPVMREEYIAGIPANMCNKELVDAKIEKAIKEKYEESTQLLMRERKK